MRKLFATTLESFHRIYGEANQSGHRNEPFYCSDNFTGELVWETTTQEIKGEMMELQQQFSMVILAEWKAIIEEFLTCVVEALLSSDPSLDAKNILNEIFRSSSRWRPLGRKSGFMQPCLVQIGGS